MAFKYSISVACIILLWAMLVTINLKAQENDSTYIYFASDTLQYDFYTSLISSDTTKFEQYKWLFDLIDELIKIDSSKVEQVFVKQKIRYNYLEGKSFGYKEQSP